MIKRFGGAALIAVAASGLPSAVLAQESAVPALVLPTATTVPMAPLATAPVAAPVSAIPEAEAEPAPALVPVQTFPSLEAAFNFDPALIDGVHFDRERVEAFYHQRGMQPVWTGVAPTAAHTQAVLDLMAGAAVEGLEPSDYPLAKLQALAGANAAGTFEVLMTAAVLEYAGDRDGLRLAAVHLPADHRELGTPADPVALLTAGLDSGDVVTALNAIGPQDAGYQALKHQLAQYRQLAAAGGWPNVPVSGDKVAPGAWSPRIPVIRARLAVTDGALATVPADQANHYDEELAAVVRRFQGRHGLEQDGVIGRETLADMATPIQDRITQLVVNLERRRQVLNPLGPDRIIVNIPEYRLRYYEADVLAFDTKVVVGRRDRQTPNLESKVSNVVVNPTWTVPQKLAGEDIVRKVLNNPNYLEEHGFEIYSGWGADSVAVDPTTIDWETMPRTNRFPYRLRQRPGEENALGHLKINFNNGYAVYMHDTPERYLFSRDMRSLSSGCVRVQNPLDLVERLITGVPGWNRERVEKLIAKGGNPTAVIINRPIGIRFTYVTAWVDTDGAPQFRDDIYGLDATIGKALTHTVVVAGGL